MAEKIERMELDFDSKDKVILSILYSDWIIFSLLCGN